jgi:starvation-inducible DNA-binding protein
LTSIGEESGAPAAEAMIRQLFSDHATAARTAHQVVTTSEACGDVATADLATQRMAQHGKAAWMLGSFLQR